jgi:hypothetical protein
MKACVRSEYGAPEVMRLVELDRPVPRPGEVLVQVRASSINMDLGPLPSTRRHRKAHSRPCLPV